MREITRSPLLGVVLVLALLLVMLIPLRRITAEKSLVTPPVAIEKSQAVTPAVLRVKCLQSTKNITLKDANGKIIWHQDALASGEYEYDISLELLENKILLESSATFTADAESAVFFTLLPSGLAEKTSYLVGKGECIDSIEFSWKEEGK